MDFKRTTILSSFVVLAGIIAEIIFKDTFSSNVIGIILSLLLAIVILVAFYFTVDGMIYIEKKRREEEAERRKEYETKIYSIMNDQLKFQKAVYSEIRALQQKIENVPENTESKNENYNVISEQNVISGKDLENAVVEINNQTMQAAKIVARYISQNSEQIRNEIKNK